MIDTVIQGDCLEALKKMESDSVDCVVTDPPYGAKFMGKDWDQAMPPVEIWQECLRVLKPGAFAFVMSLPRQDLLSRMIINLENAGFNVSFTSIYWSFSQGFPKATNLSKLADKRAGVEREVVGVAGYTAPDIKGNSYDQPHVSDRERIEVSITAPTTPEAKALDGAYAGYQPKPCLENIIQCNKPLTLQAELTIIISQVLHTLQEVLLWYNVNSAEKASSLGQPQKEYIAHRLAKGRIVEEVTTQVGRVAGRYGLMDILKSTLDTLREVTRDTNLSIELLWKSILVDLLAQKNKFTTSMIIEQITELKTLNSLLSQVISANITQASAIPQNGIRLNVTVVESYLTSVLARSLSLSQIGVPLSVGEHTKKGVAHGLPLANNAGSDSQSEVEASSVNSVHDSATGQPKNKFDQIVKSMLPVDSAVKGSDLFLSESNNPKPASFTAVENTMTLLDRVVENKVVLVAMKPLTEKTYLDQALANGHGCTWLDSGRIPYKNNEDIELTGAKCNFTNASDDTKGFATEEYIYGTGITPLEQAKQCVKPQGRFAPNLLVSDQILNIGKITKSGVTIQPAFTSTNAQGFQPNPIAIPGVNQHKDSGDFSRYFDLDKWAEKNLPTLKTFPFCIVSKPSPSEKSAGLNDLPDRQMYKCDNSGESLEIFGTTDGGRKPRKNFHPTCKSISLMAYLVAIGSREDGIVLDPYLGSGTTACACVLMDRHYTGCELDPKYVDIAERRIAWHKRQKEQSEEQQKLFDF